MNSSTSIKESAVGTIENLTVVAEEERGHGSQFLVQHETFIPDPEVRKRIMLMSVEDVFSY